jgi:hypothetical protein
MMGLLYAGLEYIILRAIRVHTLEEAYIKYIHSTWSAAFCSSKYYGMSDFDIVRTDGLL